MQGGGFTDGGIRSAGHFELQGSGRILEEV